jgi:hypothetical protein
VLAEIRAITDARPTYGYRRITALLNRAKRKAGTPQINHKRVFRLMHLFSMLLQPHTGRRLVRPHEGSVIAPTSNQRWASDGLEIPCWNGEVVRTAFAIETRAHARARRERLPRGAAGIKAPDPWRHCDGGASSSGPPWAGGWRCLRARSECRAVYEC